MSDVAYYRSTRFGRSADGVRQGSLRRLRRVIGLAAVLALLPALGSFVSAMTSPSNTSFGIRAVEWMRANGARGLVNSVENEYYSLTAPATGGPGLHALPKQQGAATSPQAVHHVAYTPPAIRPVISPALPGEGVWRATFPGSGNHPPVLITSFRPDPNYPRLVAGVAWINHRDTRVMLYPGIQEPNVTMGSARGPEEVPRSLRSQLVATFNSAFKLSDSNGGFAYNGITYVAMRPGQATIVGYRNGTVNVEAWPSAGNAGSNVVFARQNLPLIVMHGQPNPNLSDGPEWGATLGNAVRVWRSAIGIDAHGNLIYTAAPDQTVGSLAEILIRAGAVRGMELDINAYWPSFITYGAHEAREPANLLPGMMRSPFRYLTPDDRDFFAVYAR